MKRIVMVLFAAALLAASLGIQPAQAAACGATYTVQRGDYLNKIARTCGTTARALVNANSWIYNWNLIYPGQVLNIPNGEVPPTGGTTYTVQTGDTLRKIAARFGVTLDALIRANPQIPNPNRIFVGQRIRLPEGASNPPPQESTYTVQRGDYLRSIAAKFGVSVAAILNTNPGITNPNVISVGQRLTIPGQNSAPELAFTPRSGKPGSSFYIVAGNYPANTDVVVEMTQQGQPYHQVLSTRTDSTGYISKLISVPSTSERGDQWIIRVRTINRNPAVDIVTGAFEVK